MAFVFARKHKRGKTYYVGYYVDGRLVRRRIGRSKGLAETARGEIAARLERREADLLRQDYPIQKFFDEYRRRTEAIREAAGTGLVVTYEDHNVHTGLGSIVANVLAEEGLTCTFRKLGIRDFAGSGTPEELWTLQDLDVDSLVGTVLEVRR